MVQIPQLILVFLFLPQAVYQLLVWLYWWQDKEYRTDRFLDLLKGRDSLRKLRIICVVIKLVFLFIFLFTRDFIVPVITCYILCNFYFLNSLLSEGLRRPVFTQRAKRIFMTSILILGMPISLLLKGDINIAPGLILSELSILISINFGIYWTGIISNKIRRKEKELALAKLSRHRPFVIGVTGSYGKTTTKDFVFQVLSSSFKAERTLNNENTFFGVMRRINSVAKDGLKYFVCEMGAYKKGEIKEICEVVKPGASILTGVEEQHLFLFGSIENILNAKLEIAESQSNHSPIFINLGTKYLKEIRKKIKMLNLKVYFYGPSALKRSDMEGGFYSDLAIRGRFSVFNFSYEGETRQMKTSIVAPNLIENVVCAIVVGRTFGVSWEKIEESILKLKTPKGTLQINRASNKNIIIDDSHNSSPKSFESAVRFAGSLPALSRLLVTPGIIELGDASQKIHMRLSKIASAAFSTVIVTNETYYDFFKSSFGDNALLITNPRRLCRKINDFINTKNRLVLFEGKMPKMVEEVFLKFK